MKNFVKREVYLRFPGKGTFVVAQHKFFESRGCAYKPFTISMRLKEGLGYITGLAFRPVAEKKN